jgi:oligopeptide transport system ATP-binding protein
VIVRGEVPSALRPPSGCRFHPRCPQAMEVCRSVDPALTTMNVGRAVACHLHAQPVATPAPVSAAPLAANG